MPAIAWEDLPADIQHAVQDNAIAGHIVKAEPRTEGIMPGLSAHIHASGDDDAAFVKAVPVTSPAAGLYRRELAANRALPAVAPAPQLRWGTEAAGWIVMVFDWLPGRSADLSPGSDDLPAVLATVERLADMLTPCPWPDALPVADYVAALTEKAHRLLAKPPHCVPARDRYIRAVESFDPADLSGDVMLHYDLHPGNLRVAGRQVSVLDWSFACRGAAWVDLAVLAPRLIEAGNTPRQAEQLLSELTAWAQAPDQAVVGLAALWTMFREYKSLYGPPDVQHFRAQAANAGRAWMDHRAF
ncbi:phosphotransferase family protein [Actinomadura adrarensis]|uniref:Phosphotransferase family protein n=1 Tax=Actinomadura adrarensis TaxID=1819600 RepID=A0ABW3CRI6_9ACTN